MGTVELTGLEMMATHALGQYLAMPSHSVFTMPANMVKLQHLHFQHAGRMSQRTTYSVAGVS